MPDPAVLMPAGAVDPEADEALGWTDAAGADGEPAPEAPRPLPGIDGRAASPA